LISFRAATNLTSPPEEKTVLQSKLREIKMKITKRQLRRIIKEEKAKLLRRKALKESVGEMNNWQDAFEAMAQKVSDMFYDDMMKLFQEDPEMFQGRSTEQEWEQQVVYAQQELDTGIVTALEQKLEEIEIQLHDGQYDDGR
jgi:hypothetical protein